jgi:hypothetical protein
VRSQTSIHRICKFCAKYHLQWCRTNRILANSFEPSPKRALYLCVSVCSLCPVSSFIFICRCSQSFVLCYILSSSAAVAVAVCSLLFLLNCFHHKLNSASFNHNYHPPLCWTQGSPQALTCWPWTSWQTVFSIFFNFLSLVHDYGWFKLLPLRTHSVIVPYISFVRFGWKNTKFIQLWQIDMLSVCVCVICCAVFDAAVPLLFHVGVRLLFLLLVFLCASVFVRLLSLFECPWLSFAFSRSSAWPVSYNVLKCTVWLSPMICYLFVFVVLFPLVWCVGWLCCCCFSCVVPCE